MKIKLLIVAAVTLFMASCAEVPQEEKDAKRFCDCAEQVGMVEMVKQMKEDRESLSQEELKKKGEEFGKCVDFEEMTKREEAMEEEAKKVYGEKVKALVENSCPEIATAMGI